MSNITVLEQTIYSVEVAFNQVSTDKSINFKREAEFAMQIIGNNSYSLGIAMSNPQSLRDAVTNVSALGISLNPAKKLAYLVPRDGKICLDLSYMGLIELAVASGSIMWAKAELFRASDRFRLNGLDKLPSHDYEPFSSERGEILGVYVVIKTRDGDYLTDTMTIADVYDIRDRSAAWKAWVSKQKKCPWVTDEGEMIKKTVIKRAYKTWPRTDRLDQAIHYLNTDAGEGLEDIAGGNDSPAAPAAPAAAQFDISDAENQLRKSKSLQDLQTTWKRIMEFCRKNQNLVTAERCQKVMLEVGARLKAESVEEHA